MVEESLVTDISYFSYITRLFDLSDRFFDLMDNLSTSHKVHHGLNIF